MLTATTQQVVLSKQSESHISMTAHKRSSLKMLTPLFPWQYWQYCVWEYSTFFSRGRLAASPERHLLHVYHITDELFSPLKPNNLHAPQ